MTRSGGILLLSALLLSGISSPLKSSEAQGDQTGRTIPLTRAVRIPMVKAVVSESGNNKLPGSPAVLGVWPGAADEPPEGPDGFDVLDDGRLLITDPLFRRISVYDAKGLFLTSWNLGFAPDSVTVLRRMVLVRDASTGTIHVFDGQGKPQTGNEATVPALEGARRISAKNGTVDRGCGKPIDVEFDAPGSSLLALEHLATEPACVTFVALETSARGAGPDAIDVRKRVRRYAGDGRMTAEIADIPLDYFVAPVDELRVHKGVVYQLRTTANEVNINEWDTN